MYSLLIAEDEKKIAELVKILIDWDNLDVSLLGIVHNGIEAFECIKKEHPDIVVTDIKMPGMDGLEVIERSLKVSPGTKFIVLSGYRQFEFAQKAMRFGVKNYLSKPIEEEELNAVIRATIKEMDNDAEKRQPSEQTLAFSEEKSKSLLFSRIATAFLNQNPITLERIKEVYNIDFDRKTWRLIIVRLDILEENAETQRQNTMVCDWLQQKLDLSMEKTGAIHLTGTLRQQELCSLINYSEKDSSNEIILRELSRYFVQAKNYINGFEGYKVTVGLSQPYGSYDETETQILETTIAMTKKLLRGAGRIYHGGEGIAHYYPQPLSTAMKADIQGSATNLDAEAIADSFSKALQKEQEKNPLNSLGFYELAWNTVIFLHDLTEGNTSDRRQDRVIKARIKNANAFSELEAIVGKMTGELIENSRQKLQSQHRKPIRDALEYLKLHFNEEVSLDELATKAEMNPSYFSTIFKKETGSTYSDYLIWLRIEAAKQYLKSSNETLQEIAEKVGYRDFRYFSKLFTRTVGIRPSDYRKLYS